MDLGSKYSNLSKQNYQLLLVYLQNHMKKHMEKKSKMPVANIYFVLGCSKLAAMVGRVLKSNVVTSPFFYYEKCHI